MPQVESFFVGEVNVNQYQLPVAVKVYSVNGPIVKYLYSSPIEENAVVSMNFSEDMANIGAKEVSLKEYERVIKTIWEHAKGTFGYRKENL